MNRVTEEVEDLDDIKPLMPIAKVLNIGEKVIDMKWILNDTFLMIVTNFHNIVIFDSLLYAFNLESFIHHDLSSDKSM